LTYRFVKKNFKVIKRAYCNSNKRGIVTAIEIGIYRTVSQLYESKQTLIKLIRAYRYV
jgi:hypothetical protein